MTTFKEYVELLEKNKIAIGYTRNCRKYVITTCNSFLKESSKAGISCDTSFVEFINKHHESLTVLLCYYRGASKLDVSIVRCFFTALGLDCIGSKYGKEIGYFVKHLKTKLTKKYGDICKERKQISMACKVFLDGLSEKNHTDQVISLVNIEIEKNDLFDSVENFWKETDTDAWPEHLEDYTRKFLGIVQLLNLKIEYTNGVLNNRLQNVYNRTVLRIENNKYKKRVVKPDDILQFIQKLGLNIRFILQVLMTTKCNIPFEKVYIYMCPHCEDIERDRKSFFEHLYHHARVCECPFHDTVSRIYKDFGKYTESIFNEEKQMFNMQGYASSNSDLSQISTKRHFDERLDNNKSQKKAALESNSSWTIKKSHVGWGGAPISSLGQIEKPSRNPWGISNNNVREESNRLSSAPSYKATSPSFVETFKSRKGDYVVASLKIPFFLQDDYAEGKELGDQFRYVSRTFIPGTYPISCNPHVIATDLKNTSAYGGMPTLSLYKIVENCQYYWYYKARNIIRARDEAAKFLSNKIICKKDCRNAKAYFFDVLDNAWFFDLSMRAREFLTHFNLFHDEYKWNHCPFCVPLMSYRDETAELCNTMSRRSQNTLSTHVNTERKYMCAMKTNHSKARSAQEFGGCVHLASDSLIQHLNNDVHPIMRGAIFAYLRVLYPDGEIFKCLNIPKKDPVKNNPVREECKSSAKKNDNDKICALLPGLNMAPESFSVPSIINVEEEMVVEKNVNSIEHKSTKEADTLYPESMFPKTKEVQIMKQVMALNLVPKEIFLRILTFHKVGRFDKKRSRTKEDWCVLIEKNDCIPKQERDYYGLIFKTNSKSSKYEIAFDKANKFLDVYFKKKLEEEIQDIEDQYEGEEDEMMFLGEEEEELYGQNCSRNKYLIKKKTIEIEDDCEEAIKLLSYVIESNETFDYGFQLREYERSNEIRESKRPGFKFICPCSYNVLDHNKEATIHCHRKKIKTLQALLSHLCDTRCVIHQAVHIYLSELYKRYLSGNHLYKDLVGIFLLDYVMSTLKDCCLCPLLRYVF